MHVTARVRSDVTRLRRFELCKVLQRAFVYGCRMGEFRICQFSIQGNHLHRILRRVSACQRCSNADAMNTYERASAGA